MAKYKISSSNQAANTDEIVVSTNVLGKTYERSFSMKQINDMFGRALNRVVSSHGKTQDIVQSEGDMVGHIAYSLYKREKISFIEEFKKKHDGRGPMKS